MDDTNKGGGFWKGVAGVVVVVLIVWGLTSFSGGAKETGPIKIGFAGPLTGDLANIGVNVKAAVEIAVEEVNEAGGINGRPIEVVYEDDQCTGAGGANVANKLINVDKVPVILGSTCSPAMLSLAPIAEQNKVVTLGYCATAPKITEAGDYIFRDVPSDLFQANYAAKYAYNTLGKKKAAIVYLNNDWGVGLKDAFTASFSSLGGEVISAEAYEPTSTDLRSQLTKVKASTADLLYFPGFTDGTIAGIKQARTLKLTQAILGADAWDDNKVWDSLGSQGDGAMYTRVKTNPNDSFRVKMKEKIGNDSIVYCSNFAYDGIKIFAQAMSEVGTDSTKIKDALYQMTYTGGVSSPTIKFDKNGDPTEAEYTIQIIRNGKAETLE